VKQGSGWIGTARVDLNVTDKQHFDRFSRKRPTPFPCRIGSQERHSNGRNGT
jgi:hypothetical protein